VRLVGFIETSLSDWDGRITSVVFVGGCDFHCPFCHNHRIADDDPALPEVEWDTIQVTLIRKQKWVDGVVITGGEPMMHPEVFELCRSIKRLGFSVKMDTNGSFPYPLKQLIELKLVDYVAMDVKAPLDDRYSVAAGRKLDVAPVRRTIRLLLESGIEHEFRATLVPGLVNPEDMRAIGEAVRGARKFALQHYDPANARVKTLAGGRNYTRAQAESMAEALKPFVKEITLRGKFL